MTPSAAAHARAAVELLDRGDPLGKSLHAGLGGRDREREALLELVRRDRPRFACVHGPAGVGKSALLHAFTADATVAGARVLAFDCGAVEPTERGFLEALGDATGQELAGLADVTQALDGPGRTVLVLDTYERFRLLDGWIRGQLVPALPDDARLVIAGRDVPSAWRRALGAPAHLLRLENLAPAAAHAMLDSAGVDAATAVRINRLAQGHPLALHLAVGALADKPGAVPEDAVSGPVIEGLVGLYLDGLDHATRVALEAASVVRRTTISLLAAMLPDAPAADAFERLRALPFVELRREGLVVHETVGQVTTALLRSADPATYRRHRTAAWRQLRREPADPGNGGLWRHTADLLYLLDNPVVREAFFRSGRSEHAVELATPEHHPVVPAGRRVDFPRLEWDTLAWAGALQTGRGVGYRLDPL